MLTGRRNKGYKADTVEAQQSRERPNPNVSGRRLGYCCGCSREGAVAHTPGSMGILRNPQVRIKRECCGKPRQQHSSQNNSQREKASCSSVASFTRSAQM